MNASTTNGKPYSRLISVYDLIILNATALTVAYSCSTNIDWLLGFIILNNLAVIALRQWIMHILHIHWLDSLLNRALKRLADIALSLIVLVSIFPITFVFYCVLIKRRHNGAVIVPCKMQANSKHFSTLKFNIQYDSTNLFHKAPLALSILIGSISFWDITSVQESRVNEEDPSEAHHTTENNLVTQESEDVNIIQGNNTTAP